MNAEIKNIEGVVSMLDEHSSSYRAHGSAHFESIRMKHPSVADYERMLELSQDRTDVRVEVMKCIASTGGEEDVPVVLDALLKENSDDVKLAGIIALQAIGGTRSMAALDALRGVFRSEENTRMYISSAISALLTSHEPDLSMGDHVRRLAGPGSLDVHFGVAAHFGSDVSNYIAQDTSYFFSTSSTDSFKESQVDFERKYGGE